MPLARLTFCALLVVAALFVGCRSGVERDVVQRELRQQEDQIYALEDYLSEYQQLLCDARAENATLKRQMVQGQFRSGAPSSAADDTLPSPPATAPTPPPGTTQPTVEPTPTPEVPPLDLNTPEVPPLDASSANEPEQLADNAVEQASAEVEVVAAPPTAVVLRGEVHVDAEGDPSENEGPRVLLNVEPVDVEGRIVAFHGRLSVLVLDPAAREKERQLARWDFQPGELADLLKDSRPGHGYEFPLQLPAESPRNRPLELWVRLLPDDGEKLLGRTTMDLRRSGQFATAEVQPPKTSKQSPRQVAQAASAELPIENKPLPKKLVFDANVDPNGWQIARPGETATGPSMTANEPSDWKLATRPIPEADPTPLAESTSTPTAMWPSRSNDRYRTANAPAWSPTRQDDEAVKSPPLDHIVPPPGPSWAPERLTR